MTDEPTYLPDAVEVAANRETWIDALRSGNYAQGHGQLRDRDDSYCCLGVAELVRNADWCVINASGAVVDAGPVEFDPDALISPPFRYAVHDVADTSYDTETQSAVLSVRGARWLGLTEVDPVVVYYVVPRVDGHRTYIWRSLSELNDDDGLSFGEIADVVADQLPSWDGTTGFAASDAERRNVESGVTAEEDTQ